MFKTFQGVTESSANEIYLRPETAQGIFVNFKNVQRTMRKKLPFGIGQIGKSFRNEITPGNFTFRTREFEQMELEFFCKPGEDLEWFEYWRGFCHDWLLSPRHEGGKHPRCATMTTKSCPTTATRRRTSSIKFPFGWGELLGHRGPDGLRFEAAHGAFGRRFPLRRSQDTNEKYVPYCIEPSLGADRVTLAFLSTPTRSNSWRADDSRTVLHFHPALAPYQGGGVPAVEEAVRRRAKCIADLAKRIHGRL